MNVKSWSVSEWAAIIAAAASVLTALVAVVAATFAFFQVREARRLRTDQAKPFVVVDIKPSAASAHILNLVIENIGATMARDVHIDFKPEIVTSISEYDLKDTILIRDGVPMIPPGRRLEFLFDQTVNRKQAELPMRYDVTVTYRDTNERLQEPLRFPIDLTPLYGMRFVEERGVHHVAKALDDLVKIQKRWTGSRGRLQVHASDARVERIEEESEFALTGDYPSMGRRRPPELLMWLMRFTPLRVLWAWVRQQLQRG